MIKSIFPSDVKKYYSGFSLLECMVVLGLLSIFFIPTLRALHTISIGMQELDRKTILIDAGDYVGAYLFRWVKNPYSTDKIDDYYYNGSTLEYAQPVNSLTGIENSSVFPSDLKTSIYLYESTRDKSALALTRIWFDDDNDNYQDASESSFSFTTLLTEIDQPSSGGGI